MTPKFHPSACIAVLIPLLVTLESPCSALAVKSRTLSDPDRHQVVAGSDMEKRDIPLEEWSTVVDQLNLDTDQTLPNPGQDTMGMSAQVCSVMGTQLAAFSSSTQTALQEQLENDQDIKTRLDMMLGTLNQIVNNNGVLTKEEVETIISRKIEMAVENLERKLTEKVESASVDIIEAITRNQISPLTLVGPTTMEPAPEVTFWPSGTFGLLKSTDGCPEDDVTQWENGHRKLHTEKSNNGDSVSVPNHFSTPVQTRGNGNNFINLYFCMKTQAANDSHLSHQWPAGTYCINKKSACPQGFEEGSVKWDEEDDDDGHRTSASYGVLPDGEYGIDTKIKYCCRSDGSQAFPVRLPNSKPFFLYRKDGACQQVEQMTVLEEDISFDTEDNQNLDRKEGNYPDVDLDQLVLRLCYYQPALPAN